jgi:hypothetical protein
VKLVLKIAAGIILAIVLLIAGCGVLLSSSADDLDTFDEQTGIVRVDAPAGKCWSGAIGDSTKDGCGDASFTITGEAIISANAQKQTGGTWELTLTLEIDGEQIDRSETTAEYGVAQVVES